MKKGYTTLWEFFGVVKSGKYKKDIEKIRTAGNTATPARMAAVDLKPKNKCYKIGQECSCHGLCREGF